MSKTTTSKKPSRKPSAARRDQGIHTIAARIVRKLTSTTEIYSAVHELCGEDYCAALDVVRRDYKARGVTAEGDEDAAFLLGLEMGRQLGGAR